MPNEAELKSKRERLRALAPEHSRKPPTQGINHAAIFARDLDETAEFYGNVMGMDVIGVAPNRDEPGSTHMTVDVGHGQMISFFDFPHVPRLQEPAPEGVGNVMHLALPISRKLYAQVKGRLDDQGIDYQEAGGSLYVKDPNGLGIELLPEDLVHLQRADQ